MSRITLLRLPQATERLGIGKSQTYVDIKQGLLTPPVRISAQVVGWPDYEIESVIRAKIAGATPAELKALVRQLVAQRAELKPEIPRGGSLATAAA